MAACCKHSPHYNCTCTACCVHCLHSVINPNFEILTKVMYNTSFATVHYNVRDNSGRAVVIQYGGPNNLQWYENGADTPYQGAFANNPLFVPQTEYYNSECHFSEAPQPRLNCFGTSLHHALQAAAFKQPTASGTPSRQGLLQSQERGGATHREHSYMLIRHAA